MKLIKYLETLGKPERESLASSCGCSWGHLWNVAKGWGVKCSPELAVAIDRETKGQVSAEEMFPDLDWAYIRGKKQRSNVRARADVQ